MVKPGLLKGQMIIEVVVAFTITVIALVGILQLSQRSVNSSGAANRTALATAYANAAIDWVTNEKNTSGWSGLREKCLPGELGYDCGPTVYCLGSLGWSAPPCSDTNISGTEFDRSLSLSVAPVLPPSPKILKATVTVNWREGDRSPSVSRTFEFVESR
jgi:type II secretory pathway pseudopilin PulG